MTIKQALFSIEGRMSRSEFWLKGILPLIPFQLLAIIPVFFVGLGWLYMVGIPLAILLSWPKFSIGIKRLHDRGRSGIYVLLSLIPIIGPIWYIVELGAMAGANENNRYDRQDSTDPKSAPMTVENVIATTLVALAQLLAAVFILNIGNVIKKILYVTEIELSSLSAIVYGAIESHATIFIGCSLSFVSLVPLFYTKSSRSTREHFPLILTLLFTAAFLHMCISLFGATHPLIRLSECIGN